MHKYLGADMIGSEDCKRFLCYRCMYVMGQIVFRLHLVSKVFPLSTRSLSNSVCICSRALGSVFLRGSWFTPTCLVPSARSGNLLQSCVAALKQNTNAAAGLRVTARAQHRLTRSGCPRVGWRHRCWSVCCCLVGTAEMLLHVDSSAEKL